MSAGSLALAASPHPLRLGFLGVGWIGRSRMQALLVAGMAEASVIVDPSAAAPRDAESLAPEAKVVGSLDEMLAYGVDAVVIATPSAFHAEQSIRALDSGVAVFCQKPLGRNATEVRAVVDAARRKNLPLGLDLSYRHTAAMQRIRGLSADGTLGDLQAVDLVFHNGYGPDKPWFYDRRLSGGGCLMDLGIHLVDMALWMLDYPSVRSLEGHLRRAGKPWNRNDVAVEDLAYASFVTETGIFVRLACSWRQHVGCDADISATLFGTQAAARFANVGGSFYDFTADLVAGTASSRLVEGTDAWGGRAAVHWLERVASGGGFDPACLQFPALATVIDRLYASASADVPNR